MDSPSIKTSAKKAQHHWHQTQDSGSVHTVAMARVSNVPRLSIFECQASSWPVLDPTSACRCVSMSSPKNDICATLLILYSSSQVERSLASQSDFAVGKGSAWNASDVSQ